MTRTASGERKALDTYYAAIANYQTQGVTHEQATRLAFSTLLHTLARAQNWTLVLEERLLNGMRPDGTLQDEYRLPRGYWEAKDTADDLDAEIAAKITRGYPLNNTIFEDTRRARLYQNGRPAFEADLQERSQLTALLQQFFDHTGAQIENFNKAVDEFRERIPELARGLLAMIETERKANPKFVAAFSQFHELCRTALDPALGAVAIEEMLVQHLLTERLFRTVFDSPDFTARNAIAVEIEKVIQSLTRRAFSREEYFKRLDYFYLAIEDTARTIDDFAQKQAFLNTVYERFFQGFSRQQADTHGIVYTPQPIVDFMCASVEAVLAREFGKSLSDEGVLILDPCVGTGNFIVHLLRRLRRRDLKRKYERELFCNEIMLLPYYIASLNIEHAYYELSGEYAPFEGVCFVDTLDLAQSKQLPLFGAENTERAKRERDAPITVIIGNPPYNVGQKSENENNKNRRYAVIDGRIGETYGKDSRATLKNKLYDPYTKFFRWATDRLNGRDGIICFVSNNSFLEQAAFDGMRRHLEQDFDAIYHLDLHGNVRKNPKLSGTTHNVFGIQVGVGITLLVRRRAGKDPAGLGDLRGLVRYHRVPEDWRKETKLAFLEERQSVDGIEWQTLKPDAKHNWLTEGMQADFETFLPLGSKETKAARRTHTRAIFQLYSLGLATNRDQWAYDFNQQVLTEKMERFIRNYNYEVFRLSQEKQPIADVGKFINKGEHFMKWTDRLMEALQKHETLQFEPSQIRASLYRPFTRQVLYFDHLLNQRRYQQHHAFPTPASENDIICLSTVGHRAPFTSLMSNVIPNLALNSVDGFQCFPFYTYDEDGGNRRENITDWALAQFRAAYGPAVSKRDIFHYVYALLHHPQYRQRYALNLKRELPRIPLVGQGFEAFVAVGARLAQLHLDYERAPEYPLRWIENRDVPFTWRVNKMKLSADKTAVVVNESLTLAGLPPDCFTYRLGNRSALEWVIDQYQVSTDKPSGLASDPNRADDPEYIARLVGRVVTVSVETVHAVAELANEPLNATPTDNARS